MSDMRQRLLPVFLEEAGRKIKQLGEFLADDGGKGRSLDELEAAFRAAHTLKGTAALVQAESVRALSARIEGLLEGHFEKARFPSEVEYEALRLALDRLTRLVAAVEQRQEAPAGLLAEAELALKLAMTLPGRRRLADLLGSHDAIDPFADDPALDLAEPPATPAPSSFKTLPEDPFADDPLLESEPPIIAAPADPVAEEPAPELLSREIEVEISSSSPSAEPALVVDPFADDPSLEFESVSAAAVSSEPPVASPVDFSEPEPLAPQIDLKDQSLFQPEESSAASLNNHILETDHPLPPVMPSEPVEESFIERMRKRIERESPLQTATRLAETLQRQNDGELVARKFNCCHFRVASKDYFLPIENMIEIADFHQIVRLPLAPPVVRGLINLRGQVMPVIDLSLQSGHAFEYVAKRKLVIAEAGGEKLAFMSDGIPDLAEELCGEKIDVMNFVELFRAGAS